MVIAVGTIAVFDMVGVLIPRNELQNGVALFSLRMATTRATSLQHLPRRRCTFLHFGTFSGERTGKAVNGFGVGKLMKTSKQPKPKKKLKMDRKLAKELCKLH